MKLSTCWSLLVIAMMGSSEVKYKEIGMIAWREREKIFGMRI